ncbi:MAG: MFS transporter [Chloroflexota bacterium]
MTTLNPTKNVHSGALLATLTTGHMANDFYGLVLPFLLPTLIAAFELDFFYAGLLGLATSIMPSFLQPVMGYYADRYNQQKMVMLFGFGMFALGLLIVGFSPAYWVLFLGFVIYGIGQGTFHAQSTNFITYTFGDAKGRAMGIHGTGGSIGNFTVPIVVTFLLSLYAWDIIVFFLIAPAVIIIVLLAIFLPQINTSSGDVNLMSIRIGRDLWILALCIGFMLMMYRGVLIFLPTYLIELGWTITQAGTISTIMLFVGFLAQPLGGWAFDKIGGRVQFAACAVLAGVFLLLFTLNVGPYPFIFVILFGAAVVVLFPVTLAMGGELAKGELVGLKVGFVFGVSALMSAVTPPLTGWLADQFGLQQSLQMLTIFAVILFFTALLLPRRKQSSDV